MNFYSLVSNTKCHSIGHKMRIARIKIRVDSQGRWEKSLGRESNVQNKDNSNKVLVQKIYFYPPLLA